MSRLDRVTGALLGVHAGDALGATVEFLSWADVRQRYPDGVTEIVGGGRFKWPAGHATDDTDLTRAVLLAYLDPGDDVVATAAQRMLDWFNGNWPGRKRGSTPRDVGAATARGLLRYGYTRDPRSSGAGPGRAGNGSLMRCLPTALAVSDRERRLAESVAISAITHSDPRCTVSCAAYNEMVVGLLDGLTPAKVVAIGQQVAAEMNEQIVADAIGFGTQLQLPMIVQTGQNNLADDGAGYVLDSLSLAVAAMCDPRPLRDVLIDVVRVGRDTDTNAAIAGGLLGARDGVAAIPSSWRRSLQFGAEFTDAAAQLTLVG